MKPRASWLILLLLLLVAHAVLAAPTMAVLAIEGMT
jgi:hypothetical protein